MFNDTAPTEIYALTLRDARPISWPQTRKATLWAKRRVAMRVSTTRVGTALTSRLDSVSSDPIPVFPPGALDVDQGVHVLAAGIDLGRYSGIHVRRGRWRAPEMLDFPACPEMGRIDYRSTNRLPV